MRQIAIAVAGADGENLDQKPLRPGILRFTPAMLHMLLGLTRAWWVGRGLPRRLVRRSGNMFRARVPLMESGGSGNLLVLFDPDDIREVFAGSTELFGMEVDNPMKFVLGENTLTTLDGEAHTRIRRLLMPSFSPGALKGYAAMFEELAEADVPRWPVGRAEGMQSHMQRLTLDIILRTVFGVSDPQRAARLRPLYGHLGSPNLIDLAGFRWPILVKLGFGRSYRRKLVEVNEFMAGEIAERQKDPRIHERKDVLSRMVTARMDDGDRLSEAELLNQVYHLVFAGFETTATSLPWAFLELAHNPHVQRKAREAADSGDLEYLTAVAKESLRLHPVLPLSFRRVMKPTRIGGRLVPEGWFVAPWISAPHFDERYFPEPKVFRPERFLGEDQPSSHHWLPFSNGAHRCIGAAFSLSESAIILRSMLTRFTIEPAARKVEGPSLRPNIVVSPSRGGRVRLVPRQKQATPAAADTGNALATSGCPFGVDGALTAE